MTQSSPLSEPRPSLGEEIANSASHGVGLLAALVAGPVLIARAVGHGKSWGVIDASVFVAATVATTTYRWLPGVLYLALGWMIVVATGPLSLSVPLAGLMWLLAGGVAYAVGMAFFAARRIPYCHFVWHLFVLAGTTCHVIAVWFYVV